MSETCKHCGKRIKFSTYRWSHDYAPWTGMFSCDRQVTGLPNFTHAYPADLTATARPTERCSRCGEDFPALLESHHSMDECDEIRAEKALKGEPVPAWPTADVPTLPKPSEESL